MVLGLSLRGVVVKDVRGVKGKTSHGNLQLASYRHFGLNKGPGIEAACGILWPPGPSLHVVGAM